MITTDEYVSEGLRGFFLFVCFVYLPTQKYWKRKVMSSVVALSLESMYHPKRYIKTFFFKVLRYRFSILIKA